MFANAANNIYSMVSINTHRYPQHIIWPTRVDCWGGVLKRLLYIVDLNIDGNCWPRLVVFCIYAWRWVAVFEVPAYTYCRKIAATMDGSGCIDSRLKPMDARQQPILASTTNILEAVLSKHSPSRNSSALLHCCSSLNSTPPSIPETIVSTMQYRCFSPNARSPHRTQQWLPIDGQLAQSIAADNGHWYTCRTLYCDRQWPSIDMPHTLLWVAIAIDGHGWHKMSPTTSIDGHPPKPTISIDKHLPQYYVWSMAMFRHLRQYIVEDNIYR